MDDYSVKFLFWFLVILLILNRLVLRFFYKRKFFETMKDAYEEQVTYYRGFFHATWVALIALSLTANYPAGIW